MNRTYLQFKEKHFSSGAAFSMDSPLYVKWLALTQCYVAKLWPLAAAAAAVIVIDDKYLCQSEENR